MFRRVLLALPGLQYLKGIHNEIIQRMDGIVQQLKDLCSQVARQETEIVAASDHVSRMEFHLACLEEQIQKTYDLFEHRADQIHRNVAQAMATHSDPALAFPSLLHQDRPQSLRETLLSEKSSEYRAGTYVLSPDDARFAAPFNEWERIYYATHLKRFEVTLELLAGLQERHPPFEYIADLSTSTMYHPGLLAQFPQARFVFTSPSANLAKDSPGYVMPSTDRVQWFFDQNLESRPLPLDDASVDLVMLLEVLEHFAEDPMFAFAEVNRVLKPGGLFFLSTPNLGSWHAATAVLTRQSPMLYSKFNRSHSSRHFKEWVADELGILFHAAGFSPAITSQNVYFAATPATIKEVLRLVGIPNSLEGDTLFAVGTKIGPVIDRYPPGLYDE